MKNSRAILRLFLAVTIGLFGLFGLAGVASAGDGTDDFCQNRPEADDAGNTNANDICTNDGDATSEASQEGNASSGDGVAGQVVGVVSAGDASVDATNRSDDVDVETGNATGTNSANLDATAGVYKNGGDPADDEVCENRADASESASSTLDRLCANEGDAEATADQAADAASGDGVGGQVIGVVTSAGGSADLVLDNESTDSDVTSGEADFTNTADAFGDAVVFDIAP